MKYKTMLLASAAVMFAGSAMAADLTNPFYTPNEGAFTSDTAVAHNRVSYKHGVAADKQTVLGEKLTYGVTDQLAVWGAVTNYFDTNHEFNNDHNFEYNVGTSYNMREGNVLAQVAGGYYTWNPKDFYGKKDAKEANGGYDRWEKYLEGELKLGYDMGDGLVPYVTYKLTGQVDIADRELDQSVKAGVHKYDGDWAVDAGVRYDFNTDGKNSNKWFAEAAVDYYVRDNVALGMFGDYFLAGNGSDEIRYDYTAGAHVKVLF